LTPLSLVIVVIGVPDRCRTSSSTAEHGGRSEPEARERAAPPEHANSTGARVAMSD
jgi:hypothetical protein